MPGYNYNEYVTSLSNTLVVPANEPNFVAELPRIIDDAEQRIYRELDLLSTIVTDASGTLSANSRRFTFPQHFVVSESINVFTPVGTTTNRIQLVPATREFIDAVYGNDIPSSTPSIPHYYAMITDQTIIVGPPPDASYTLEVIGTIRPLALSASNPTTYLTEYLPDLFFAASMVFGAGYLQNFGAVVDNPQMAVTWEGHTQELMKSANIEELRKKYQSFAWSPKQPYPVTTPPRA